MVSGAPVVVLLADELDEERDAAFWAGVEFQRRYETHVRDLVDAITKPAPRPEATGDLAHRLNGIRNAGHLLATIRDAAGPAALTRYCHASWELPR